MSIAVEVKESFTVQSPAVVFGMFTENVKTFVRLAKRKSSELPALYSELAAAYARVPGVQESSGGLPGDPDTF
jgi:hypothetical protein